MILLIFCSHYYQIIKDGDWPIVFEKLLFFGAVVGAFLIIIGMIGMFFS